MTEKLAAVNSPCGTTGENIFKEVEKKKLCEYKLKCHLLRCITAHGGKNICRRKKGLVGQIYKVSENVRCLKLIVFHCIIH